MLKSALRLTCTAAAAVSFLIGVGGCSNSDNSAQGPNPSEAAKAESIVERDPGTLRLLYGRSVVTLNPHLATGYQDFEAARMVYEPLASYDQSGQLVLFLAAEIPHPRKWWSNR
jgi:peptide/nickel transport system substrate-binding protein